MADRLKIEGNFIVIFDSADASVEYVRCALKDSVPRFKTDDTFSVFISNTVQGQDRVNFDGLTIEDDRTGLPFTSVADLKLFLSAVLSGFSSAPSIISPSSDFIFVSSLGDLPDAVGGVRTLLDQVTYYFITDIDLLGDRLVHQSNTVVLGTSSENASITSTGLSVGTALISGNFTTPVRHINIKDVDTAFDLDGDGNTMALDWTGVNISNVPNIGTFKNMTNFVFSKGAFLNSKGLVFDESVDTVSFDLCLLQGDGLTGSIVSVPASSVVSRRVRILNSAVIAFGDTQALNVDTDADLPVEGYILDNVSFSGSNESQYIVGVQYDDNKALFKNCTGVTNSANIATYYMVSNTTATTFSGQDVPTKALGVTSPGAYNQRFDSSSVDNRATRTGVTEGVYESVYLASVIGNNNVKFTCYTAKDGVVDLDSRSQGTANGSDRAENIVVKTVLSTSQNSYRELYIENNSNGTALTVSSLNYTEKPV